MQQSPFSSVPFSIIQLQEKLIVDDLNIAYNRVIRTLNNAMKRKPRVADSTRKMKFGNEVVVLQAQLFRTVEVPKQLCYCLFGAAFETFEPHEIYSQSSSMIVIHIHSLNRFSEIFSPANTDGKNEPLVVELKSGEMMGCTARVSFYVAGIKGQASGFVIGEFIKDNINYIRVETDAMLNSEDNWNTDDSFESSSSDDDDDESKKNKTKRTVMELVLPSYHDGRWKSVTMFENKKIHIIHYYPIRMRINLESYLVSMTLNRVSYDKAFKLNH
jgi:hypothetical protein